MRMEQPDGARKLFRFRKRGAARGRNEFRIANFFAGGMHFIPLAPFETRISRILTNQIGVNPCNPCQTRTRGIKCIAPKFFTDSTYLAGRVTLC